MFELINRMILVIVGAQLNTFGGKSQFFWTFEQNRPQLFRFKIT